MHFLPREAVSIIHFARRSVRPKVSIPYHFGIYLNMVIFYNLQCIDINGTQIDVKAAIYFFDRVAPDIRPAG